MHSSCAPCGTCGGCALPSRVSRDKVRCVAHAAALDTFAAYRARAALSSAWNAWKQRQTHWEHERMLAARTRDCRLVGLAWRQWRTRLDVRRADVASAATHCSAHLVRRAWAQWRAMHQHAQAVRFRAACDREALRRHLQGTSCVSCSVAFSPCGAVPLAHLYRAVARQNARADPARAPGALAAPYVGRPGACAAGRRRAHRRTGPQSALAVEGDARARARAGRSRGPRSADARSRYACALTQLSCGTSFRPGKSALRKPSASARRSRSVRKCGVRGCSSVRWTCGATGSRAAACPTKCT